MPSHSHRVPLAGGESKVSGEPRGLDIQDDVLLGQFKRSGSERLRDGAKAFLRRMESLKNKKKKRQNRDGVVISGPKVSCGDDGLDIEALSSAGESMFLLNLLAKCLLYFISTSIGRSFTGVSL